MKFAQLYAPRAPSPSNPPDSSFVFCLFFVFFSRVCVFAFFMFVVFCFVFVFLLVFALGFKLCLFYLVHGAMVTDSAMASHVFL